MGKVAAALKLSKAERKVLEAVCASSDISTSVQRRARIILLAGKGIANSEIALKVKIGRAYVLDWRERYQEGGIRALWVVRKSRPDWGTIRPETKSAILNEAIYRTYDLAAALGTGAFSWTTRDLAKRHRVSRASVGRILAGHGVEYTGKKIHYKFRQINLRKFRISQDPLFGLTIVAVAGLFYEPVGPTIALQSAGLGFRLASLPPADVNFNVQELVQELQQFDGRSVGWPDNPKPYVRFLEKLESKRKPNGTIHLLVDSGGGMPLGSFVRTEASEWLLNHEHFLLWPSPQGCDWIAWVDKWLRTIGAMPVQAGFVKSIVGMTRVLTDLPKKGRLATIVIC